jgi:hypothetical protein
MTSRSKDPNINEEAFSEQESYDREPSVYDIKAQQAEVTPVEAFKQNVDGDQSPCIVQFLHSSLVSVADDVLPVPKVAACVPNTDDPDIACNSELHSKWHQPQHRLTVISGQSMDYSERVRHALCWSQSILCSPLRKRFLEQIADMRLYTDASHHSLR